MYPGKDILEVLPTGCGKSLIFQLIPNLIAFKKHMLRYTSGTEEKDCVALVIRPLDSLMDSHSKALIQKGISIAILRCGGWRLTLQSGTAVPIRSSSSDD